MGRGVLLGYRVRPCGRSPAGPTVKKKTRGRPRLCTSTPLGPVSCGRSRASPATQNMIKLFSLKQEKEKAASAAGSEKKVAPGLIRMQKGEPSRAVASPFRSR